MSFLWDLDDEDYEPDYFDYDDDFYGYDYDDDDDDVDSERLWKITTALKKKEKYILKGDGKAFLAEVWKQVQEGASSSTDVRLQFQDDKEMCVSSAVLSNVSEYFQIMLSCGMRENLEGKVTLPTVTSATFNRLLAFTLGQEVEMESREELVELLVAADMMQVKELMEAGVRELETHLTVDNCLETLAFVRRIQPDEC